MATELRVLAGLDHVVDQLGRNVSAEHALDATLLLLLLDHLPDQRRKTGRERRAQRRRHRQQQVAGAKQVETHAHVKRRAEHGHDLGKDTPAAAGHRQHTGVTVKTFHAA